jgi:hypothetical protein
MLLGTARDYSSNFNYPFLVLPNWFTLGTNVELYRALNVSGVMMEASVGLYPIVTLQYNSTTLYQVSYHIR